MATAAAAATEVVTEDGKEGAQEEEEDGKEDSVGVTEDGKEETKEDGRIHEFIALHTEDRAKHLNLCVYIDLL